MNNLFGESGSIFNTEPFEKVGVAVVINAGWTSISFCETSNRLEGNLEFRAAAGTTISNIEARDFVIINSSGTIQDRWLIDTPPAIARVPPLSGTSITITIRAIPPAGATGQFRMRLKANSVRSGNSSYPSASVTSSPVSVTSKTVEGAQYSLTLAIPPDKEGTIQISLKPNSMHVQGKNTWVGPQYQQYLGSIAFDTRAPYVFQFNSNPFDIAYVEENGATPAGTEITARPITAETIYIEVQETTTDPNTMPLADFNALYPANLLEPSYFVISDGYFSTDTTKTLISKSITPTGSGRTEKKWRFAVELESDIKGTLNVTLLPNVLKKGNNSAVLSLPYDRIIREAPLATFIVPVGVQTSETSDIEVSFGEDLVWGMENIDFTVFLDPRHVDESVKSASEVPRIILSKEIVIDFGALGNPVSGLVPRDIPVPEALARSGVTVESVRPLGDEPASVWVATYNKSVQQNSRVGTIKSQNAVWALGGTSFTLRITNPNPDPDKNPHNLPLDGKIRVRLAENAVALAENRDITGPPASQDSDYYAYNRKVRPNFRIGDAYKTSKLNQATGDGQAEKLNSGPNGIQESDFWVAIYNTAYLSTLQYGLNINDFIITNGRAVSIRQEIRLPDVSGGSGAPIVSVNTGADEQSNLESFEGIGAQTPVQAANAVFNAHRAFIISEDYRNTFLELLESMKKPVYRRHVNEALFAAAAANPQLLYVISDAFGGSESAVTAFISNQDGLNLLKDENLWTAIVGTSVTDDTGVRELIRLITEAITPTRGITLETTTVSIAAGEINDDLNLRRIEWEITFSNAGDGFNNSKITNVRPSTAEVLTLADRTNNNIKYVRLTIPGTDATNGSASFTIIQTDLDGDGRVTSGAFTNRNLTSDQSTRTAPSVTFDFSRIVYPETTVRFTKGKHSTGRTLYWYVIFSDPGSGFDESKITPNPIDARVSVNVDNTNNYYASVHLTIPGTDEKTVNASFTINQRPFDNRNLVSATDSSQPITISERTSPSFEYTFPAVETPAEPRDGGGGTGETSLGEIDKRIWALKITTVPNNRHYVTVTIPNDVVLEGNCSVSRTFLVDTLIPLHIPPSIKSMDLPSGRLNRPFNVEILLNRKVSKISLDSFIFDGADLALPDLYAGGRDSLDLMNSFKAKESLPSGIAQIGKNFYFIGSHLAALGRLELALESEDPDDENFKPKIMNGYIIDPAQNWRLNEGAWIPDLVGLAADSNYLYTVDNNSKGFLRITTSGRIDLIKSLADSINDLGKIYGLEFVSGALYIIFAREQDSLPNLYRINKSTGATVGSQIGIRNFTYSDNIRGVTSDGNKFYVVTDTDLYEVETNGSRTDIQRNKGITLPAPCGLAYLDRKLYLISSRAKGSLYQLHFDPLKTTIMGLTRLQEYIENGSGFNDKFQLRFAKPREDVSGTLNIFLRKDSLE